MQATFAQDWALDPGRLADQAFMVQALLDVAEASADVSFLREASYGRSTQWLTCATIDALKFGADRDAILDRLAAADIEGRPVMEAFRAS